MDVGEENFNLADLDVGISFDDVFLVPKKSKLSILDSVCLHSFFTPKIRLAHPFVAGSNVSGDTMGIEMARNGGIAIMKYASIEEQVDMVSKVKSAQNFIDNNPQALVESANIFDVNELTNNTNIASHPICNSSGIFLGMVSARDFYKNTNVLQNVLQCCVPSVSCVSGPPNISRDAAEELFRKHKYLSNIPLVQKNGVLSGMISMSLLEKTSSDNNLYTAVSVNCKGFRIERIRRLVEANTDVIVIEEEHAYTTECIDICRRIRERYPKYDTDSPGIIVGNIFSCDAIEEFVESYNGCIDGIKIGQPKTALECGFGVPLLTSIFECSKYAHELGLTAIADIGKESPANMIKALAAGASCIVMNDGFANTKQSILPKEKFSYFENVSDIVAEWSDSINHGVFYGGGTLENLRKNTRWIYNVKR